MWPRRALAQSDQRPRDHVAQHHAARIAEEHLGLLAQQTQVRHQERIQRRGQQQHDHGERRGHVRRHQQGNRPGAHQRKAARQSIDAIHQVERIDEADHGEHRKRDAQPAEFQFVAVQHAERVHVSARRGNHDQDCHDLHDHAYAHAQLITIVERAESDQNARRGQHDVVEFLGRPEESLTEPQPPGEHAHEDREAAHQRGGEGMSLSLIRVIEQSHRLADGNQHAQSKRGGTDRYQTCRQNRVCRRYHPCTSRLAEWTVWAAA